MQHLLDVARQIRRESGEEDLAILIRPDLSGEMPGPVHRDDGFAGARTPQHLGWPVERAHHQAFLIRMEENTPLLKRRFQHPLQFVRRGVDHEAPLAVWMLQGLGEVVGIHLGRCCRLVHRGSHFLWRVTFSKPEKCFGHLLWQIGHQVFKVAPGLNFPHRGEQDLG